MAEIIDIDEAAFDELVGAGGPVFVFFRAEWSAPAGVLQRVIEQLADHYDGAVPICRVDVDTASGIAARERVMSVPQTIMFNRGDPVGRKVGYAPFDVLRDMIDAHR